MKMIPCPNCGKLLESKEGSAQDKWIARCPRCGNIPLLEDSQVITISGGEMGGPGLRNLQDKEKELIIHAGVAAEKNKVEESVIEAEQFTEDADVISAPPPNTRKQEATVEELSDTFDWEEQKKQMAGGKGGRSHMGDPRKKPAIGTYNRQARPLGGNVPSAAETDRPKKNSRTIQRSGRRVYSAYYAWFAYGVPSVLLAALILFALYQVIFHKDSVQPSSTNLQEIWDRAKDAQYKAYDSYKEALELRDMQLRQQKLQHAADLYQEAIKQGRQVWNAQIKLLMEANQISEAEALQYAQSQYGGYLETMQRWEQSYYLIQEKIKKIKATDKIPK
jgi:hypothetical protein